MRCNNLTFHARLNDREDQWLDSPPVYRHRGRDTAKPRASRRLRREHMFTDGTAGSPIDRQAAVPEHSAQPSESAPPLVGNVAKI